MKNIKMAETATRYGMTMAGLESLLVELGWIVDGKLMPEAYRPGYLTEDREIGPRGVGFLDGYLGRF